MRYELYHCLRFRDGENLFGSLWKTPARITSMLRGRRAGWLRCRNFWKASRSSGRRSRHRF